MRDVRDIGRKDAIPKSVRTCSTTKNQECRFSRIGPSGALRIPIGISTQTTDCAKIVAMRIEHVFGDLRPFAQCHAPTLLSREDGSVLVAWFGGTREGHRNVSIWSASRAPATGDECGIPLPGANWTTPRSIAKVGDEPHWNPVLFARSPRDFVLHFKVGKSIRDWVTWSQRSTDAGETWSEAQPLVPGDRGGRGAVKNKPIQLASGEWLAGASTEVWRRWDAFVDRSPDGLVGWESTAPIPVDRDRFEGKGVIQPSLWESQAGHVHALLRSTAGSILRSDSHDAGRTWSPAFATRVANNNSGLDVVRTRDGLLALACNPVAGNWAARTPLSILFSGDNGETWPARIDIETEPGEFSYPAIIETDAGLCVAYTWNRRRIAVAWLEREAYPDL